MQSSIKQSLSWIAILVSSGTGLMHLHAQGRQTDYQRAMSLSQKVANKVAREQIQPFWRENGTFWYRIKSNNSGLLEWIEVDPSKAQKTTILNSDEWKSALAKMSAQKPSGNVIEELEPATVQSGQPSYRLRIGNQRWIWNPVSKELKVDQSVNSLIKPAGRQNEPRASLRQGPESFLTLINKTMGLVNLQWIDPDGKPKGYGHLQPGQQRRQHTFGGHVWRAFDEKGDDLAWIEADDEPMTVEIQAQPAKQAQDKPTSNKRGATPDGKRPSRSSKFEIRDFNIYQINPEPNPASALTLDGSQNNAYRGPFLQSPDGRFLLAQRVVPEQIHKVTIVESSPKEQLQPKRIEFQYLKPGDQIELAMPCLIDLNSRKSIALDNSLFENPWSLGNWHWAEDSSEFYFLYNQRGHQVVRLIGIDPKNGRARIAAEEKYPTFVDYTNKIWHIWLEDSKKLIWMSERSGFNHLYVIDVKSGTTEKALTKGDWVIRKIEKVDHQARQIWFYAAGIEPKQDPYHLHLARVNFDGSQFQVMTEGDGSHSVTFSPDGKYLLDRFSRVDLPPVYELRSATNGQRIMILETADATSLIQNGWTMPQRFVSKGRDGKTDIHGVLYTPSNLDPLKKYPVVEEIYAGPHGAHVPKSWGLQMRQHQMAELGFIVVQIDGMGTNWRGKSFHDIASKNLADAGFPDRKIWIRAAAESRPWMDLSRIGIYGGSAGGQNAMRALIDHHDFYKVAVADCGCHDNRMDKIWWNEQWLGWPVGEQYDRNSNSVHAHRMQGKLLLMSGELDQNVDPASTMQVVNALIKSNKDFELLIIPGAGHGSAETPYGSRRRMNFLVRHLYGIEPPSQ